MDTETKDGKFECPICKCAMWFIRPSILIGNDASLKCYKWAMFALRIIVGAIFAYHGAQKAFGWFGGSGFQGAIGAATATGLKPPVFWAFMLVLAEFGGGIALILGVGVRLGALLNAIVMAVAMLTVHRGDAFTATHTQQMLLVGCIALVIAGGGALSIWPAKPISCELPKTPPQPED